MALIKKFADIIVISQLFRSLSKFGYVGDISNFERVDFLQIRSSYPNN
jgi:hypothetical protein